MLRDRSSNTFIGAVIVALAIVLSPGIVRAQEVTGTLFGKVTDSSGGVMPGVTVTIRSAQLIGGAQVRTTDESGQYRIPAIPPGTYEVTFEIQGFQRVAREGVTVDAGASIAVDAKMEVAAAQETVSVVGSSSTVDIKDTQGRATAPKELIENIPTEDRNFVQVFDMMPGVTDGGYTVATTGTNSVNGGSDRENSFTIDGVNGTDPLVAYPATDLDLDLIEQIQTTTTGMSAEFGGASGGVFNVITKSGGNTIHGSGSDYFRNKSLEASNLTPALRAQGINVGTQVTNDNKASATLGGPVIHDRLWYFGDYQRFDETQTLIAFTAPIQATQDAYFAKVSAQVSKKNKVEGFYQYRLRYDYPFQPDLTLGDSAVYRKERQSNNTLNAKWTSVLTDHTFLEARGSIADQQRNTGFPNVSSSSPGYEEVTTGIVTGGWFRDLAEPGNRNTQQVKADLTHFATNWGPGQHDIKTGVSYDWLVDQEVRNWDAGAMLMELNNGKPYRIVLSNDPVDQNGNVNQLSAYAQDQWTVNSRLTLNLGVRFESVEGWYPAGESGGVNFPQVEFPAKHNVLLLRNAAPRLGLAYDLLGNHKIVLKATFDRFYNQLYVGEFSTVVPYAYGTKVYQWINTIPCSTCPYGVQPFQPGAGEEGKLISDSTVPALGTVDPNVKPSYVQEGTFGVEGEIARDLTVGATVILKNEYNLAEVINTALPFDTAYNPITLTNKVTGAPITIYAQKASTEGTPTVPYYTNPGSSTCSFCPNLTRNYRSLQLTATKRMGNRWQLFGSYVYERGEGNKENDHNGAQTNVFGNPNDLVNAYGALSLDRPQQFKLQGTYQAPWDFVLSAAYSAISGLPWAPTIRYTSADSPLIVVESGIVVNAEPLGTQRYPVDQDLDLRAERQFKNFGKGRTLDLMLDVFNVLNLSTVTSYQQTRIDLAGYQKAGAILLPRTFSLGARFVF